MEEKPKDRNGKELKVGQRVKARLGNPLYYEAGILIEINSGSSRFETHDGGTWMRPNSDIEIMEI